jgi:hypothetical protein
MGGERIWGGVCDPRMPWFEGWAPRVFSARVTNTGVRVDAARKSDKQ